ncbi:uncharacterized protein BDCG_17636 [Blastomyces dermatitidis ER-3]|uniref:Uncharacterized protein n=1 Tax=Ajellomyces dermatitidis (strain ER-3 / ATCC MYA-2586) TaxID=559297 RepID=A0ABM9YJ21_AJEDR|nr:uncharacterized protein BDCG_17636 [Blastomyces dermatitidis ER-3]EEQ92664.2 hypothetical protein BDCG_17636 [Blastomyces dermatitidis ER-3]
MDRKHWVGANEFAPLPIYIYPIYRIVRISRQEPAWSIRFRCSILASFLSVANMRWHLIMPGPWALGRFLRDLMERSCS